MVALDGLGWDGWWLWMDGREQKVGFAEKKLRLTQKNGASCVSRVACTYLWAAFVWGCVLNERAGITNS